MLTEFEAKAILEFIPGRDFSSEVELDSFCLVVRVWNKGSEHMHGLNHVENENDIMHYQTSLQRKKDSIPGSNSKNSKGSFELFME